MNKTKIYALLIFIGLAVILTVFTINFGLANTILLISIFLHLVIVRNWLAGLKRIIVEAQHVLGENDKKLLKRIQSVENKLDDR